tara:strand:- start:23 stop:265 length:243 start_codon:yes stop_codon:yes gene_type:complete
MENISNLSILFNILINGMITVFLVLFLVYLIGRAIIYFFDSVNDNNVDINNDSEIQNTISKKIKDIAGDNAEIISYRKLD